MGAFIRARQINPPHAAESKAPANTTTTQKDDSKDPDRAPLPPHSTATEQPPVQGKGGMLETLGAKNWRSLVKDTLYEAVI